MKRAACTIVSPNYLAYARTLSASYLAQHPGHRFFVLLVADLQDAAPLRPHTNLQTLSPLSCSRRSASPTFAARP